MSICADFCNVSHPQRAAEEGAQLYATSVLISENGYRHDSVLLQGHAERHGMAVLMANHGGPTGGWLSAGKSALWDESGRCVVATAGAGNRLLIVVKGEAGWHGRDVAAL